MSKGKSKSNIVLLVLLIILIVAVLGFGGYFIWRLEYDGDNKETSSANTITNNSSKTSNQTINNNYEDTIISKNNIEKILEEIPSKLSKNDAYYFMYFIMENMDSESELRANVFDKSIRKVIDDGKQLMQKNGYTLEKFLEEYNSGEYKSKQDSSGNLGDYYVEIGDAQVKKDKNGKPILVVNVKYTNNGNSENAFAYSIIDNAYQDGVQIESASDWKSYDSDSQFKQLLKGATYNVQVAYELNNTTSDVVVIMTEFISLDSKKVTKTFKISE